jgi:hypothetical protein
MDTKAVHSNQRRKPGSFRSISTACPSIHRCLSEAARSNQLICEHHPTEGDWLAD